ncbi:MAG: CBS domain-containing protein [Planctomycetota bacterium]|nr:MAG: CBS domain-containing protein [Planctomycetota bacterium]
MSEQPYQDPREFQDPLENYDAPEYADALEKNLMEQRVSDLRTQPFISIGPELTVREALATLVGEDIACATVVEDGRLVGLFSDRDALERVALEYDDVCDKPVREVMTKEPLFVREDDSPAAALCVMAGAGYRFVPVLGADDRVTGLLNPPRLGDFLQAHFDGA